MAKLLAIKAHPLSAKESISVSALEHFLTAYRKSHPEDEIEVLDLYEDSLPEIDQELLSAWEYLQGGNDFNELAAGQQEKVRRFNEATEQFLAADKIVIANALWNLNVPTRLKAWLDAVCVAGKTFRYTAEGPQGLTSGKRALHIQANGGHYNGSDFSAQYVEGIMDFVGVKDFQSLFIEGADHDPAQREAIIQAGLDHAAAIAENF